MFLRPIPGTLWFAATVLSNIGYHIATWLVTVAIGLADHFVRSSECVFGIEIGWCRVCFKARLETDPRR